MNWVDFAIFGAILISALIGVTRGLIREVMSLAVWVIAVVVAWVYYKPVADMLTAQIAEPSVRLAAAFVGLVLAVLILGSILAWLVSYLVEKARLSWADRTLGLGFGAVRGAVLVAVAVFLAGLTPMQDESWWKESQTVGDFQTFAGWLLSLVPPEVQAQLKKI